ncbi:MAG: gamma-glutamylcyclotransferase family protein [Burkholderiaceae bacterium]
MTKNLFAYGSLMLPEIFSRVTREKRPYVPATLSGWKRCQVMSEPYPAIVRASASSVSGILWIGLGDSEMTRLDTFEGAEYERIAVEVTDTGGGLHLAETYAWALQEGLVDAPWDFEWFQAEGIKKFNRFYL